MNHICTLIDAGIRQVTLHSQGAGLGPRGRCAQPATQNIMYIRPVFNFGRYQHVRGPGSVQVIPADNPCSNLLTIRKTATSEPTPSGDQTDAAGSPGSVMSPMVVENSAQG